MIPAPVALRDLGSKWAGLSRTVALSVPSAIIPSEVNVLLNPQHADMARVVIHAPESFAFNPRMRKSSGRLRDGRTFSLGKTRPSSTRVHLPGAAAIRPDHHAAA